MHRIRSSQKGFSSVEFLLILIIVALVGVVGWIVYKNNPKASKTNVAISSPTDTKKAPKPSNSPSADPYSGWVTYKSKLEGLSFKYPADWRVTQSSSNNVLESTAFVAPSGYKLEYLVNEPLGVGSECGAFDYPCPKHYLKTIEVPNFGKLYSDISYGKDAMSNTISLTDSYQNVKDGQEAAGFPFWKGKPRATYTTSSGSYTYYRLSLFGSFPDAKTFPVSDFKSKPEVVTTQKIYESVSY